MCEKAAIHSHAVRQVTPSNGKKWCIEHELACATYTPSVQDEFMLREAAKDYVLPFTIATQPASQSVRRS